jgi:hypothetical protein
MTKSRYFSVQLVDLYTFNFGYIGSRTTGNNDGSFLIAGPGWKGAQPPGVKKVFRCETEFALAGFRAQLFNPGDLDNVKKVQAGYKVQPLSQFLGKPGPPDPPTIDFIKPLTPDQERTLPQFFNILKLRVGILSHRSIGKGTHGAVGQAQHRRGQELRRDQAITRN